MSEPSPYFTPDELRQWQFGLQQANLNNVFCHCRQCDREWVASSHVVKCTCGSTNIETLSCWQFPDG